MGDRSPPRHQVQVHPQHTGHDAGDVSFRPQQGPSTSQVLAVLTLLPLGGTLFCLSGIIFILTLIGLAVTTPLFIIFSPIILPAVITLGLAVTGFLGSGAFGLTGLSSLSWLLNFFRQASESMPEQIEQAKKQAHDLAVKAGQKTKDVGYTIERKAHEGGRS